MPVQTSNLTSGNGDDLNLTPDGSKKLKIASSLDTSTSGETVLATTTSSGVVKRLNATSLSDMPSDLQDDDWLLAQDTSDGAKIKKMPVTALGKKQPPLPDIPYPNPSEGDWVAKDSVLAVKEGGNGTTAAFRKAIEFSINGGTYDQNDKNVRAGDRVSVKWTDDSIANAQNGDTISGTLYAKTGGNYEQTWNKTISGKASIDWSFVDVDGADVDTEVIHPLILPTGITRDETISISGGNLSNAVLSVNGGAYSSNSQTIGVGETFQVKGTSDTGFEVTTTVEVTIDNVVRTWSVKTRDNTASIEKPIITAPINGSVTIIGNNPGEEGNISHRCTPYKALGGAALFDHTEWELDEGTYGNTIETAQTTSEFTPAWDYSLPVGTYWVRAKHIAVDGTESPWSDENGVSESTSYTIEASQCSGPGGAAVGDSVIEGGVPAIYIGRYPRKNGAPGNPAYITPPPGPKYRWDARDPDDYVATYQNDKTNGTEATNALGDNPDHPAHSYFKNTIGRGFYMPASDELQWIVGQMLKAEAESVTNPCYKSFWNKTHRWWASNEIYSKFENPTGSGANPRTDAHLVSNILVAGPEPDGVYLKGTWKNYEHSVLGIKRT